MNKHNLRSLLPRVEKSFSHKPSTPSNKKSIANSKNIQFGFCYPSFLPSVALKHALTPTLGHPYPRQPTGLARLLAQRK